MSDERGREQLCVVCEYGGVQGGEIASVGASVCDGERGRAENKEKEEKMLAPVVLCG